MITNKKLIMKCLLTLALGSASAIASADASPALRQALNSAKQGTLTAEQKLLLQNSLQEIRVDGRQIVNPSSAERLIADLAPKKN